MESQSGAFNSEPGGVFRPKTTGQHSRCDKTTAEITKSLSFVYNLSENGEKMSSSTFKTLKSDNCCCFLTPVNQKAGD